MLCSSQKPMIVEDGESLRAEMRAALDAVLASPAFAAKRRGELLRYLGERALRGESESITEYAIGLDVFGKPVSFDPRAESTIRAEMSRLRKALAEYYLATGKTDPWRVEFPAGGYVPRFAAVGKRADNAARTRAWLWRLAAALAVVAAGVVFWKLGFPARRINSAIVLPFANLTGDPANDYVADGMTEGLTDSLAQSSSLRVVARTSAYQFRGKALDIREIGKRVNAEAVIEGSLRKNGDTYQVTVQVNRAADGYHIRSRVFSGRAQDLPRIQGEMAAPVFAALRLDEPQQAYRTPNAEAWDLVLRARTQRRLAHIDTFNQSVTLLDEAIQKDPGYSGAWAELANVYAGAANSLPVDIQGAARKAKAAAERAIELDPKSAEAYSAEGMADATVFLDWPKGEGELRTAVRLAPQDALVHQRLANVELLLGHFDVALREAKISEDLDPLQDNAGMAVGMVFFMERRYRDAARQLEKMIGLHPDVPILHLFLGSAYDAAGDLNRALAEFRMTSGKYPRDTEIRTILALIHAGRAAEARKRLEQVTAKYDPDPFSYAVIYGELGERDAAFAYLEQAWERHDCWMLKVYPFLDPLRKDPRFDGFLKRAHLS